MEIFRSSLFNDANFVAYYRGADANDSKGSFHLTNSTGVAFVPAKYSNGPEGNGVAKNLFITNNLGIDGGAITVSCWVKPNSEISSGSWALWGQTSAASKVRYEIFYDYNGGTRRLTFNRVKNNVAGQGGSYNIALGTSDFFLITLTYDGSTIKGYVNGAEVASASASGSGATTGNSAFILFARDNGENAINQQDYANVILDDVGIWSRALTADEISGLYKTGFQGAII